jgi:hypothetical protein
MVQNLTRKCCVDNSVPLRNGAKLRIRPSPVLAVLFEVFPKPDEPLGVVEVLVCETDTKTVKRLAERHSACHRLGDFL